MTVCGWRENLELPQRGLGIAEAAHCLSMTGAHRRRSGRARDDGRGDFGLFWVSRGTPCALRPLAPRWEALNGVWLGVDGILFSEALAEAESVRQGERIRRRRS